MFEIPELIGVIKSLRQANVPNVPVPIEQKAMKDSELVGVDSGIHAPQSYLDVSKEHEKGLSDCVPFICQ